MSRLRIAIPVLALSLLIFITHQEAFAQFQLRQAVVSAVGGTLSSASDSLFISGGQPHPTAQFSSVNFQLNPGFISTTVMDTSGMPACTFGISPTFKLFADNGGSGSVQVITSPGCTWTAVSNEVWLTITSADSSSGAGNVTYSVVPNTGSNFRLGTITIAGKTFQVGQEGTFGGHPLFVANPIPDQQLRGGDPPFVRNLVASPPVFLDPDGNNNFEISAFSNRPDIAGVRIFGKVLRVYPLGTGTAVIELDAFNSFEEEALTSFTVSVTDCWELDTFDDFFHGSVFLRGRKGWRSSGSLFDFDTSATIVANPFGSGGVLKIDAAPASASTFNKNVNDQLGGKHSIKMNVLIDGNPGLGESAPTQFEIRTTGNADWDKKLQLLFGADMRLKFGPAVQDVQVFLPAIDLIPRHWYEVEAVVDLDSNVVDINLDGQPRLSAVPLGPGALTEIALSARDLPGVVYFDEFEFCRINPRSADEPIASSFDDFDGGWNQSGDFPPPQHSSDGGNPGGFIQVECDDPDPAVVACFEGPVPLDPSLLNLSDKSLNFDMRQMPNGTTITTQSFGSANPDDVEEVTLEGGGLKVVFDTPNNPGPDWTSFSIPLRADAGWKLGSLLGPPPTPAEMETVLSSLSRFLIRGDFNPAGGSIARLDNVVLGGPVLGVGPLQCASFAINDANGNGRPERGESVALTIELVNRGVVTATGVHATLSTEDPDISISTNSSDWPDVAQGDTVQSLVNLAFEVSSALAQDKVVPFILTVTASSGDTWMCTFDVLIFRNSAPTLSNPFMDKIFAEDAGTLTLARLDTVFSDPDGDTLNYSLTVTGNSITANLIDSLLVVSTVPDSFGTNTIVVTAMDEVFSVSDSIAVTITPVNDAPSPFSLLAPAEGDVVDARQDITFEWHSASDVDGDSLRYTLRIFNAELDTAIVDIADTSFVFDPTDILSASTIYSWTSLVTDGVVTVASSDTVNFTAELVVGIEDEPGQIPQEFVLYQNYPNPFNPTTTIRYDLAATSQVRLVIYNFLGQTVRTLLDETQGPGFKSINWDARDNAGRRVASGIYIYRMQADNFVQTKKMLLLR